uniref:Diuretic hormone receptor n=3 Tax=Photinus pyralis TaxID=7054 RepID=A0A1Y1KDD1_PHOPY
MDLELELANLPQDSRDLLIEMGLNNNSHLINVEFPDFNSSDKKDLFDLYCKIKHKDNENFTNLGEGKYCNASSDLVLCWPPTPANTTAYLKCFSEFLGYKYDDRENASRECLWNGTWSKSDYSFCWDITEEPTEENFFTTSTIYFVGYTLSLVALSIAIGIFIYFKDLRCLRNTIHTNLMCAYILVYALWIVTLIVEQTFQTDMVLCVILVFLLHYFHVTTFFWMFVEGLYLYILVVETLTRENFKLRIYATIGWGLPFVFVLIWAITKSFIETDSWDHLLDIDMQNLWKTCPWIKPHTVDWIFQAPITLVLALNSFFLIAIMWVLITKLRSANTLETQQYRKAAKALLVLKPLLGVTYVLTIAGPTTGSTAIIFAYARAVLLSLQGFTVALFYCFLNTEVQNTLKHHFQIWRTSKTLGSRRMRTGSRSKDWSPRSRTESIRLYSQPTICYNKRESNASDLTMTTLLATNGSGRPSNGGIQIRGNLLQPPRNNV